MSDHLDERAMSEITPETLFADDVLRWAHRAADTPGDDLDCVAMRAVLWAQVQPVITRLAQERDEARIAFHFAADEVERTKAERDAARQEVVSLREMLAGLAITAVTSGASPQKDGGMSPPLWLLSCKVCSARWHATTWKYRDAAVHPAGDCLLAGESGGQ